MHFVVKSTSMAKMWGLSQLWQCQDFDSAFSCIPVTRRENPPIGEKNPMKKELSAVCDKIYVFLRVSRI